MHMLKKLKGDCFYCMEEPSLHVEGLLDAGRGELLVRRDVVDNTLWLVIRCPFGVVQYYFDGRGAFIPEHSPAREATWGPVEIYIAIQWFAVRQDQGRFVYPRDQRIYYDWVPAAESEDSDFLTDVSSVDGTETSPPRAPR